VGQSARAPTKLQNNSANSAAELGGCSGCVKPQHYAARFGKLIEGASLPSTERPGCSGFMALCWTQGLVILKSKSMFLHMRPQALAGTIYSAVTWCLPQWTCSLVRYE
jgi:hypothetical protein